VKNSFQLRTIHLQAVLRYVIAMWFASTVLQSCGERDVIASGIVRDSVTKLPVDSVRVVQFWVEKKSQRILNETYTDSTGRFLNWDFLGCGIRKCRFMVVFDKEGYLPQTHNNLEDEIQDMVIELVPQ
jgi:hypothetical protein